MRFARGAPRLVSGAVSSTWRACCAVKTFNPGPQADAMPGVPFRVALFFRSTVIFCASQLRLQVAALFANIRYEGRRRETLRVHLNLAMPPPLGSRCARAAASGGRIPRLSGAALDVEDLQRSSANYANACFGEARGAQ